MANVSWDDLLAPAGRRTMSIERRDESRVPEFLRSGDTWLSLMLIVVSQLAVVTSLHAANWVDEMPSLLTASMVGVLSGWLLGHVRQVPRLALYGSALAIGVLFSAGMVLRAMQPVDLVLMEEGWTGRLQEFWLRMGDWWAALIGSGISTDPLPFVLGLVFVTWGVGFIASWGVFRLRNAWVAVVPGGFVLLTNISYLPGQPSFAFVLFLFTAMLLVARVQLMRAQHRWRGEHAVRPEFLSFEVLTAATWIGLILIVFAWVVPTANHWGPVADTWQRAVAPVSDRVDSFGRLFVGIGSKKALPVHAFGDVLPLQGSVQLTDTPLLSVTAPEEGFLRGAVYDEYSATGWRVSGLGDDPLEARSVDAAELGTPLSRSQIRQPVRVEIEVLGELPPRRLLSVGEPIAASVAAQILTGGSRDDSIALQPNGRVRPGDTYETVGTVSVAALDTLFASGTDYPDWVRQRYLQLPADLPPEIQDLSRRLAAEDPRPYATARRIEQYLRDGYALDLDVESPPPRTDAVAYFLFESQRGYFDHHASAMAVMLRTLGIPSRVAVGFALDDRDLDSETKTYLVSERRSWAWTEVYFEGLGWVEFNPTPGRPLIQRPGDDSQFTGGGGFNDEDFDLDELFLQELLFELDELGEIGAFQPSDPGAGEGGSGVGALIARALTAIVAISAALIAIGLLARFAWEYAFRGLSPARRRWAKVQRLLSWAGLEARPTRTPHEAMADVSMAVPELRTPLTGLARSYTRDRYAGTGAEESEAEAEERDEEYREVRNRLLRLAAARLVPFSRRRRMVSA